jgi:sugar phosphate isomerase/epimerase
LTVGRHPLSLAAGVMPDFDPVTTTEAAVAAGWDMAGVWVDFETWTPAVTKAVRKALGGLPALDVEYIRLTPGPLPDTARRLADVGAELGAANLLLVSGDPDDAATAAKLAELAEYCQPRGLRAALEFGVFTAVKSLDQAIRILDAAAHPAAAVLLDSIHLDRAGVDVAQIARIPPERLPYAQFCDASADRPDPDDLPAVIKDALDLRLLPGEGVLPLKAYVEALPPEAPLSVELRSAALRAGYPDARDRSAALLAATRAWMAQNTPG